MLMVCNRCGAHIKNTFRVGDFVFGGDCIQKVDAALMQKLYGNRLELGEAINRWAFGQMHSRAKGAIKNPVVDLARVPKMGASVKWGNSTLVYEVVGYSELGVRVRTVWKQRTVYNNVPFNKVEELEAA